jgi:hypothetical protein
MPTLTIHYQNENERLMLEQAIAYVTQLQKMALSAPVGTVLDACEKLAVDDGRQLLRTTLAAAVQSRIAQAEQKGGQPVSVARRTLHATREPMKKPS